MTAPTKDTLPGAELPLLDHAIQPDPSVIGQKILVNDYPMTIVGVSAPDSGLDPATVRKSACPFR